MTSQIAFTALGLCSLVGLSYAALGGFAGGPDDLEQGKGASTVVVAANDPRNPTPGLTLTSRGPNVKDKVVHTETEWKKQLTPKQYAILRGHGTEAAFCSPLLANHGHGTFYCAACGNALFTTDAKFNSGTGWPSFFQPATKDAVWYKLDTGYGMRRTEVNCSRCDSHLGHVFDDGPADKGGRRYCMNGEALDFKNTK